MRKLSVILYRYLDLPPHPSRGLSAERTGKVSWLSRLRPPSHLSMTNSGKTDLSTDPVTGIRITVAGQQRFFTAFPFPVLLSRLISFYQKKMMKACYLLLKIWTFLLFFILSRVGYIQSWGRWSWGILVQIIFACQPSAFFYRMKDRLLPVSEIHGRNMKGH